MDHIGIYTGAGIVLLSFLFWFIRWFNDWRFARRAGSDSGSKLPPGSMGWPLIGEMFDFLWCFKFVKRPDDFINKRKLRYGDVGVYRTNLFGYPTIVSCSPEFNKQILGSRTEDGSFGPGWPATELFGETMVVVTSGMLHKKIRRHFMQAFNSPSSLHSHLAAAQPSLISALEDWASKGRISAYHETRVLTFRNICEVITSFKSKELLDTMEYLYTGLMGGIRAMTINIPGTAFHHALKCRKKLSDILLNEIRRRKEHGHPNNDFLKYMMESVDENGDKLTETEIKENVVSIILGGYESTSNVMAWGLYYLAKYPEELKKLKEEVSSIQERKSNNELLTPEDIKNMKYTSNAAEELIRLANITPFVHRKVMKDNVVVNGYKFPKDWKVAVWIRSLHIDSRYFDDPLTFNPNRWNDTKPKAGVYSAFGGGPRLCPGNNFAKIQIMMFLYHVCLKYRWELLNPDSGMIYLPQHRLQDGVQTIFTKVS